MTNPIGAGTVNRALNMHSEESRIWGRIANEKNVSVNQLLLAAARIGMSELDPAAAGGIATARSLCKRGPSSTEGEIEAAFLGYNPGVELLGNVARVAGKEIPITCAQTLANQIVSEFQGA